MSIFFVGVGSWVLKWKGNSVECVFFCGVIIEFVIVFGMDFYCGCFFFVLELYYSSNKVVLGYIVVEEFFGNVDFVGKFIKL